MILLKVAGPLVIRLEIHLSHATGDALEELGGTVAGAQGGRQGQVFGFVVGLIGLRRLSVSRVGCVGILGWLCRRLLLSLARMLLPVGNSGLSQKVHI